MIFGPTGSSRFQLANAADNSRGARDTRPFPDIRSKGAYPTSQYRRPIKMSPLCQLEMKLPWGFSGVFGVTVRLISDWGAKASFGRAAAGCCCLDK